MIMRANRVHLPSNYDTVPITRRDTKAEELTKNTLDLFY